MEVDPLSRLSVSAALHSVPATQNDAVTNRQIVKAVQDVNQSELLGQNRELEYRRDPKTGQMVVQTVNRQNGDVVDQIPLEVLLRLQAEVEEASKGTALTDTANLG
ncbi:MAG: flagellar protein FlaG [Bryobacteraceae bacterium]